MNLWLLGLVLLQAYGEGEGEELRRAHEVARMVVECAEESAHLRLVVGRALASIAQSVEQSLSSLRSQATAVSQLLDTMEAKMSSKEHDPGINITVVEQQFEQLANVTKRMHTLEDHLWDSTSPRLAGKVDQGLDYQLATKEYLQEGLELVLRETEALDLKVRREAHFVWVYSLLGITSVVVLWSLVVLVRAVKS